MNGYEKLAQAKNIYLDANVLFKTIIYEGKSSNLVNLLIYPTTIHMFSSYVALGEWIGKYNRRTEQRKIGGAEGYLHRCRQLMTDFDVKKIKRAEPSENRSQFIRLSKPLLDKYSKLGGADIWHLMAVLELKRNKSDVIMLTFDKDLKDAALQESIDTVYGHDLKEPDKMIEELRCRNKWMGP